MRKIVFVVAGVFLASFVAGRAESLIAHHGFAGPAAWAQGWDEPSDGAIQSSEWRRFSASTIVERTKTTQWPSGEIAGVAAASMR